MKSTNNDKHAIGAWSLSEVFAYIDVDYSVHGKIIIHMGGDMSMVYGIIHGKAPKQKINVNILIEAELV